MCKVGLPQWLSGKEFTCNEGDKGDADLIPPRHLPAHLPDTRKLSRATPARSSA